MPFTAYVSEECFSDSSSSSSDDECNDITTLSRTKNIRKRKTSGTSMNKAQQSFKKKQRCLSIKKKSSLNLTEYQMNFTSCGGIDDNNNDSNNNIHSINYKQQE